MAISCVYCGSSHDDPSEVRACWQRSPGASTVPARDGDVTEAAPAEQPQPRRHEDPPPSSSRTTPRLTAAAARWAGPDQLGRGLVLVDSGEVPHAWADAARIVLDDATIASPGDLVTTLRSIRQRRDRVVVELRTEFLRPPGATDPRPLHEIGARGEFLLDELHHLVWANSVLLDLDGARWPLAERAVDLGAEPCRPGQTGEGVGDGVGDVIVPGVGPVWLDGGQLRFTAPIDGVAVVPAVTIEHGSLQPFGTNHSAAELAADQLEAVTHAGGGARIIAPAGSGKTRVLTERARHLVHHWGLPASAVTLVAYNRRAQAEMQARLADVPGVQVRTLNSLALAILNGGAPFAPRPFRSTTVDEREVRRILDHFVPSRRVRNVDPLAPWLEALSAVRLGLRSPDDVEDERDGDVAGLAEVLPHFEAALADQRMVDFDGQIVEALRVLLTDPAARRAAQRACRLLLVDEFQDLTPAHLLMVRLLAAPERAVFGVGDDDQTIYGYNGADPSWLIDYHDLFPGSGEHPLEVNYRCPGDVVSCVDRMLRHTRRRVQKTIRAHHADRIGLERLSSAEPLAATVEQVCSAIEAGTEPADIAVLSRVNVVLVPVQVALALRGVPATTISGREFLDRTAVRSALAWLRIATAPEQRLAASDLALALQRPSRSMSPRIASWAAEQRTVRDLGRLADRITSERDAAALAAFTSDVQLMRNAAEGATTAHLLELVSEQLGLAGTLATFDRNRRGMNTTSQYDDLAALAHLATLHPDPATFPGWLAEQLDVPRRDDGVMLSTVHRVKGQEWPLVVVHLADDGEFPHRLADDVEEERRLFHVALTRTSGRVVVVSSPVAPSPFLAELDREPPISSEPEPRPLITSSTSTVRSSSRRAAGGSSSAGSAADPAELDAADRALFEALRALRDRLRRGKPAYTVFDNATLFSIIATRPNTLGELARVRGIGPSKLEQYGHEVLAVVAEHATNTS